MHNTEILISRNRTIMWVSFLPSLGRSTATKSTRSKEPTPSSNQVEFRAGNAEIVEIVGAG
jgi:hypothetical protein